MKLTKKKLEQLITEEYVRSIADEGKPVNYPEYADKLTALAKSNPIQARSLADSLEDPLDIEYDPNEPHNVLRPHKRDIDEFFNEDHMLHWEFVMDGHGDSLEEEPDISEMIRFANRNGLEPHETIKRILSSWKKLMMRMFARPETPNDKMRSIHGIKAYGD